MSVYIPVEDIIGSNAVAIEVGKKGKKHKTILAETERQDKQKNLTNFMEFLEGIPSERVKRMQEAIEHIGYSLQYSIPPISAGIDSRWTPPFKDSVDIILENMLSRVRGIVSTNVAS